MAEINLSAHVNLNGNQLKGASIEVRTDAPENPVIGQIYFNSVDNKIYRYTSEGWQTGKIYSCINPSEGELGAVGVYFGQSGDTFKFRLLKSNDRYITIAEGADPGLLLFGLNVSELPVQPSVVTKLEDYYTKSEVDAKITGIYKIKGTVDYFNELPDDPETGDVWLVRYKGEYGTEPWGAEFVWIIDEWDELGSIVDLSAYEILNADTTPSEGIQLWVDDNGTLHIDARGAKENWEAFGNQVLQQALAHSDANLQEAKVYTDTKVQEAREYSDTQDTALETRTREYIDTKDQQGKEYTDTKVQEAKTYADEKDEQNSQQDRAYTDAAIDNVKRYAKSIMTAVGADDASITVREEVVNDKSTYHIKVSQELQDKIDQAVAGNAKYYYTAIPISSTSPWSCNQATHKCGDKLMVQVSQNNKLVEVETTITNGVVMIEWNGQLTEPLFVMIFGIN
jgi:hypothetical protein